MGTSADNVIVTSGVTAEKLMYDRALEMSRSAAVNELVGDDLPGCEIAYVTAVRMLEALLEDDEEPTPKKNAAIEKESTKPTTEDSVNGVEAEDREVVLKRKSSLSRPTSPDYQANFSYSRPQYPVSSRCTSEKDANHLTTY